MLVDVDRAEAFDDVGCAFDFRQRIGSQGHHVLTAGDGALVAGGVLLVIIAEQVTEEILDATGDAGIGIGAGCGAAVGAG